MHDAVIHPTSQSLSLKILFGKFLLDADRDFQVNTQYVLYEHLDHTIFVVLEILPDLFDLPVRLSFEV
jgi:hypothetical protein